MLLRVFLPLPSSFYSRVACPKLIFQFCFILHLFWNLSLVCFIHVFLPIFYIFSYLALYLHLSVMTVQASLFTCIYISVFVCTYLYFSLPVFIFLLTWFCIFSYLALYLHLSVITCLAVQGNLLTTTAPPQATQQREEKRGGEKKSFSKTIPRMRGSSIWIFIHYINGSLVKIYDLKQMHWGIFAMDVQF